MTQRSGAPWLFRVLDAATAGTLEIAIYDVIGRNFFGEGVGQADVLAALNSKPKASVLVRVASIGGLLDDAKTMKALFAERIAAGYGVEFRVESLAASAAAYLLTTPGATVNIAADAFVMIHKARGGMRGTDADMEAARKILADANQMLAQSFAEASAARGKNKTAADFLAEMANNRDRYFSADESLEWGLVDAKLGAMKVAACAVDLAELTDLPEAIVAQLAAARDANNPPAPTNPTPPVGGQKPGTAGKEQAQMDLKALATLLGLSETATAEQVSAELTKRLSAPPTTAAAPTTPSMARALGLPVGATETDIVARATTLRELEIQVLAITNCKLSGEAVGAMRGIKAAADESETLRTENATLKGERDQQAFDALLLRGQSTPVKLSLASAKHYSDRFEAAKAEGRGAEVVSDLEGFLKVAPPIIAERKSPPKEGTGSGVKPTFNGKTYAELKFSERARLSNQHPELFRAMKDDFEAAQA